MIAILHLTQWSSCHIGRLVTTVCCPSSTVKQSLFVKLFGIGHECFRLLAINIHYDTQVTLHNKTRLQWKQQFGIISLSSWQLFAWSRNSLFLWNQEIYNCGHKSTQLDSILIQFTFSQLICLRFILIFSSIHAKDSVLPLFWRFS